MPVRTVTIGPRVSGGGERYHGVGFDLDSPLEVGELEQSAAQALFAGTPQFVKANSEDPPTGQNLILDIEMSTDGGGSWGSIFPAGNSNKVNITPGSKAVITLTSFAISSVAANAKFRPVVIEVGAGNPGGYVSMDFVWKVA